MRYWLYDTALTLATPFGLSYLAVSSRHRTLLGRFSPRVPEVPSRPIWVHACSVGEVGAAQPILAALKQRYPSVPVLLTTSTVTGRQRALTLAEPSAVAWFPFDHPYSVSRFLQRSKPQMLVLIETELWPNVLRMAAKRGIPATLVNGRLSDRHFRRYQRLGRIVQDMMYRLTTVGVQDETYAVRFAALGLDRERIQITGNLKFDGVGAAPNRASRESLRAACGIPEDAPVLVVGSTRPGDERLAIECWQALQREWPDLRLILAPRHVERVSEVRKLFSEPVRLRSELDMQSTHSKSHVTIVDTHGELVDFYSIATVAAIGGSFDPAIQGHNPIEPAAMGVPAVFGPHMRNFSGASELLVDAGASIQIAEPSQLQTELGALLRDADLRKQMGRRGQEVVAANRGALQRTLEMIEQVGLSESAGQDVD